MLSCFVRRLFSSCSRQHRLAAVRRRAHRPLFVESLEARAVMSATTWGPSPQVAGQSAPQPAVPTFADKALSATIQYDASVRLVWSDVRNATRLSIDVQTSDNRWRPIVDNLNPSQRAFTFVDGEPGRSYTFRVTAYDNTGHTASTNSKTLTVPKVSELAKQNSATIDALDVAHNWLRNKKTNETYCNVFVSVATAQLGAPIPQKLANDQQGWLLGQVAVGHWRELSARDAQLAANRGAVVVASWKNPVDHGHIAMVRPDADTFDSSRGPLVAQAGWTNMNRVYVGNANSFGSHLGEVRYFAFVRN